MATGRPRPQMPRGAAPRGEMPQGRNQRPVERPPLGTPQGEGADEAQAQAQDIYLANIRAQRIAQGYTPQTASPFVPGLPQPVPSSVAPFSAPYAAFPSYPGNVFAYEAGRDKLIAERTGEPRSYFPPRHPLSYSPERARPRLLIPGVVSPGEQDLLAHGWTNLNRWDAQLYNPNIFLRPLLSGEPYTPSLYQVPYNTSRNLISTGTLINPYTGEVSECFENQLPPPNTTKGALLKSQLAHPNPMLINLQQFNGHLPPPRKHELAGADFKPVSALGGGSVFGNVAYDGEIARQSRQYLARDLYGNQDGTPVVTPDLPKEQPWGYRGLQPMYRFVPVLPATQELDLAGRMPNGGGPTPSVMRREEYTPDFQSLKAHNTIDYSGPLDLVNGVEAITQIPIVSEHLLNPTHSDSRVNSHVNPVEFPAATSQCPNDIRAAKNEVGTLPTGAPTLSAGDFALNASLRGQALDLEQTLPTGVANAASLGDVALNASLRGQALQLEQTLPTSVANASSLGDRVQGTSCGLIPEAKDFVPVVAGVSMALGDRLPPLTLIPTSNLHLLPVNAPALASGDLVAPNVLLSRDIEITLPVGPLAQEVASVVQPNFVAPLPLTIGILPGSCPVAENTGFIAMNTVLGKRSRPEDTVPLNNPNLQVGSIAMQSSLKTTDITSQHPIGPAEAALGENLSAMQTNLIDTRREIMPFASFVNGPQGNTFGLPVPLGLHVTHAMRGKNIQPYDTQDCKVLDGVGGSSTRVISSNAKCNRDPLEFYSVRHISADATDLGPPTVRPMSKFPQRAFQDLQDLTSLQK
jgi:hypothetical protein